MCDGCYLVDRWLSLCPGQSNVPDGAVEEELVRCLYQRGERAVGVFGEELLGGERPLFPRPLQLLDELVQRVGASDVHAVAYARVAMRTGGDQDRVHLAVGAVLVVAAKVAGI